MIARNLSESSGECQDLKKARFEIWVLEGFRSRRALGMMATPFFTVAARRSHFMRIGPFTLASRTLLAPMVGVTDQPFRALCRQMGAGLATSEMTASDLRLWDTDKSRRRRVNRDEIGPRSVQIVGSDPVKLAEAARHNADLGAQIIDINMGCPAKKICNVAAGSALMKDEVLIGRILESVVMAAGVPVTLKIRTGWDPDHRNGVNVAQIAERSGIVALAVHGRTRACAFGGAAEYETIAAIKSAVGMPVIANGDIDSPEKAQAVLKLTQADAVMVGRAAQGRPWIFREIEHYFATGQKLAEPTRQEVGFILYEHIKNLHEFYGEHIGVQIARKHIGWYTKAQRGREAFRARVNVIENATKQLVAVQTFFQSPELFRQTSQCEDEAA